MSGKTKDVVHMNAIHVETVMKEQRLQKLHTVFSMNPYKKVHVVPDKPMSRKQEFIENSDFIKAYHEAHEVPTKKYSTSVIESHEIGWVSTPLIPANRHDERLNFFRKLSDVTTHQEFGLRRAGASCTSRK